MCIWIWNIQNMIEYVNFRSIYGGNIFSCSIVSLLGYSQVKRCAEMSRKLRFFKDQIHKASLGSPIQAGMQPDIELEELEVCLIVTSNLFCPRPCKYNIRYWSSWQFVIIFLLTSDTTCWAWTWAKRDEQ